MPTWDEITPGLERQLHASRLTCTNVLLGLHVVGFVLSGLLPRVLGIPVAAISFDAHHAIERFWVWQFFTYPFVQVVDIIAMLFFVMAGYSMFLLGNELEYEIGRAKYLTIYFGSVAYGGLVHALFQYVSGSIVPAISIFVPWFAILVASACRFPGRTVLFAFVIPMRMWASVLLWGVVLLFFCIIDFRAGLSPFAVLSAGIAALAIYRLEPKFDTLTEWLDSRRERTRMIEGVELRYKVDLILEKISREGMGALTRTERRILKRASEATERERGPRND